MALHVNTMKTGSILAIFLWITAMPMGCASTQQPQRMDILQTVVPFSSERNDTVAMLYEAELNEASAFDAAHDIYYCAADLDADGTDELLAYFMSALHTGSLGNAQLDIWQQTQDGWNNIGPISFALNPRYDDVLRVSLEILPASGQNFPVIQYLITTETGAIDKRYAFDGAHYAQQESDAAANW